MKEILCIFISFQFHIVTSIYNKAASSICDPIGTNLASFNRYQSKPCICLPEFSGIRCDRIYRCHSGRATTISCLNPPSSLVHLTKERCIRGQMELDICMCFQGYEGHLCERMKLVNDGKTSSESNINMMLQRQQRWPRTKEIGIETDIFDDADGEEEDPSNLPSTKTKIVMLMLIIMSFICLIVIYVYFKILRLKFDHHVRSVFTEVSQLRDNQFREVGPKIYHAPPSYDEAAAMPPPSSSSVRNTNENNESTQVERPICLHV